MRNTFASIDALVAAAIGAIAGLALGCATPLEIQRDDLADFARYHTWSWLPDTARTIDAPTPYAIGLDRELARLVEGGLAERGLERVERGGDLRIGALLNVRREQRRIVETGAVEQLTTFTSDGSYEIQRGVVRIETFERSRLAVYAVSARSRRVVWKGALEERFRGEFTPHLGGLASRLLAHFPEAGVEPPRSRPGPPIEITATPPGGVDPGT